MLMISDSSFSSAEKYATLSPVSAGVRPRCPVLRTGTEAHATGMPDPNTILEIVGLLVYHAGNPGLVAPCVYFADLGGSIELSSSYPPMYLRKVVAFD